MRLVTKGTEDECIDTPETLDAVIGDPAGIGEVREVANSESGDRQVAMKEVDAADVNRLVCPISAFDLERVVYIHESKIGYTRIGTIDKNVIVTAPQNVRRSGVREHGDRRSFIEMKSPEVVEARDVIEVFVRYEKGVQAPYPQFEALSP